MREGGEKEQAIRAAAFARLPGIAMLDQPRPAKLAEAVRRAVRSAGPPPGLVDLSGAETTARILLGSR